jgi:hypothetical protein
MLAYEAPTTCPGAQSYIRQVESRATALSIDLQSNVAGARDATTVSVSVSETVEGWAGKLAIADAEGHERTVHGDRCEDVIEALALITVLRLEPSAIAPRDERTLVDSGGASDPRAGLASTGEARATLQPGAGAQASSPVPAAPSESVDNLGQAPAAAEPPSIALPQAAGAERAELEAPPREQDRSMLSTGEETAAPLASRANIAAVPPPPPLRVAGDEVAPREPTEVTEPEPIIDTPDTEPDSSAPSPPLRINVAGYLSYASVPSNAFELSLQGELPLGAEPGWAASFIISYARGSEENSNGAGVFNLWTVRAQLCGPALAQPDWWLQPCAAVRGGFLNVDISPGEQTFDAPGAIRPWAALGPGFQAGVPLASGWSLRALGELSFVLVRDFFEVERTVEAGPGAPDDALGPARFYRPSALSFELGIGLGYAF